MPEEEKPATDPEEQARLQEAAELAIAEHASMEKAREAVQTAREQYRAEKEQGGKK